VGIDKRYDSSKPVIGSLLISEEVRDNFQALDRTNELRPVLATTRDIAKVMALWVEAGYYATSGASTSRYIGGFSGDFDSSTITSGMERTDTLVITSSGNLQIQQGFENVPGNSIPLPYPSNCIPIAEVVMQAGATSLADLIYVAIKDVRPLFITSASGFGINPTEEVFTATAGQQIFDLTTFSYSPGDFELNVFVGGVRKNVGDDFLETGTTQITFLTGIPSGEKIVVWKVGSASSQNLADLDDMTVDLAEAVTDPDANRPNPANRNNPFATLSDVSGGVGAIPFAIQHNSTTGEHGPQVSIVQPNDDVALVVNKNHTGNTGAAVSVVNSGSAPGVHINQLGDGIGISLLHFGASAGLVISDANTGSHPALYVDRAVTSNRESFIRLEDTASVKAVDVSFYNDEVTFDDNTSNTYRITLNANRGAIALLHNTGSNSNLLITKSGSDAAGRSINIIHSGAGEALNIEHLSTSPTPAIRINRANTASIAMQVDGISVDSLWRGTASVADTLHTHKFGTKSTASSISAPVLYDLTDVSSNQSSAFAGAHSPSVTNPLATLSDINSNVSRTKLGTYTGNGGSQSVSVGFQPDWVTLYNGSDSLQSGVYVARGSTGRYFSTPGTAGITITATGFDVSGGGGPINQTSKIYFYIAIKGDSLPVAP
jgi:hypothetical protein